MIPFCKISEFYSLVDLEVIICGKVICSGRWNNGMMENWNVEHLFLFMADK